MIWVIEYIGAPAYWISGKTGPAAVDVTSERKHAKSFLCREDAMHEMLRLGLSSAWTAKEIGGGE